MLRERSSRGTKDWLGQCGPQEMWGAKTLGKYAVLLLAGHSSNLSLSLKLLINHFIFILMYVTFPSYFTSCHSFCLKMLEFSRKIIIYYSYDSLSLRSDTTLNFAVSVQTCPQCHIQYLF